MYFYPLKKNTYYIKKPFLGVILKNVEFKQHQVLSFEC